QRSASIRISDPDRPEYAVKRIRRYYPYLDSVPTDETGSVSREAVARTIRRTPGVTVGTGVSQLPVAVPTALITRHQVILGRSGSGKTTLINRELSHFLSSAALVFFTTEQDGVRNILPRIPNERAHQTVLLSLGSSECPVTFSFFELEKGADQARSGADLYHAFKASTRESSIGGRSDAIARHLFLTWCGLPGASFLCFRPFLEDRQYRHDVLRQFSDEETIGFWEQYEEMPTTAALPLLSRISEFTAPSTRRSLCATRSSFSLRAVLDGGILIVDLSALSPDTIRLAGSMLLSRIHLELMRRDEMDTEHRTLTLLCIDEFHTLACATPAFIWKDLCARSRRMNCGLLLASQSAFPIPRDIRDAIFSNASTFVAFSVSAKEAAIARKELPVLSEKGEIGSIKAEKLVSLPVGTGYARVGGSSALAMKVRFFSPEKDISAEHGERVKQVSWATYAAPPPSVEMTRTQRPMTLPTGALDDNPSRSGGSAVVEFHAESTPEAQDCLTSTCGQGGYRHRDLQALVLRWSEAAGYRGTIEKEVLGGVRRLDVALERDDERLAVEVALSNRVGKIHEAVSRAFLAGFDRVIVVSPDEPFLERARNRVEAELTVGEARRTEFLTPDGVRTFLEARTIGPANGETAGYRVRVEFNDQPAAGTVTRQKAIRQVLGKALDGRAGTA
ncbi:MAG: hypothetical protein ACE5HD_12725, partial [Acidobacteriota bacterium]